MKKLPLAAAVVAALNVSAVSISSLPKQRPRNPTECPGAGRSSFDDEFTGTAINTSAWDTHMTAGPTRTISTDHASNVTEDVAVTQSTTVAMKTSVALQSKKRPSASGNCRRRGSISNSGGTSIYNWPPGGLPGRTGPPLVKTTLRKASKHTHGQLPLAHRCPQSGHRPRHLGRRVSHLRHLPHRNQVYVYWDSKLVELRNERRRSAGGLILTMGAANTLAYGTLRAVAGQLRPRLEVATPGEVTIDWRVRWGSLCSRRAPVCTSWQARHPAWVPDDGCGRGGHLLLPLTTGRPLIVIDPLAPAAGARGARGQA